MVGRLDTEPAATATESGLSTLTATSTEAHLKGILFTDNSEQTA